MFDTTHSTFYTAHLFSFCRQLGSDHGDGSAMLSRESVPLHDEIPVFAELAAIRVSNESLRSKECSSILTIFYEGNFDSELTIFVESFPAQES